MVRKKKDKLKKSNEEIENIENENIEKSFHEDNKFKKDKIIILFLVFLSIIFILASIKFPIIYNLLTNIYKIFKLPFEKVYLFNNYLIFFPDYFFLNLILFFITSGFLYFIFLKRTGYLKREKINKFYLFFILFIVFLHLIVVGYYVSNKSNLTQAIIFLFELILLGLFFIYLDQKEKRLIFYNDILTKNELKLLLIFMLFIFFLYSFDQLSWKYSFIGDEYSFYEIALSILNGKRPVNIFSEVGVYSFNPELSSIYQAIVMAFFPWNKLLGWKISSALVVVFSIIPFYTWSKLIFNRTVAIITTVAFAFCHTMLAFGHIGYNNIQAVFPFIAGLCCFEIAIRKKSYFWTFLTGIIVGLGCYNYYFTRLLLILVPLYWFLHPLRKNFEKKHLTILFLIILAIVMFIIINPHWLGPVMQRSVIKGSEVSNPQERPIYVILNFIYTFFIFLFKTRDSHFVVGGMTDIVTSIGVLFGFLWVICSLLKDWRAKFLIISYLLYVIATGAISMYNYPANTRIQSMVPLFAILAGVGLSRLLSLSSYFNNSYKLYRKLIFLICLFIALLNIYKFYFVMPKKFQFTMQAYVLQAIEKAKNKKCILVADRLPFIHEVVNYYKYSNRFEMISTSFFENLLQQDSFKGKVVIIPFDAMVLKPEVANFIKKDHAIYDFLGEKILIYIYDFTDEKYYNAFKELWFTGKTDYILLKKEKIKSEKENFKIKIFKNIFKKEKSKIIEQKSRVDIPLTFINEGFKKCPVYQMIEEQPLLDFDLKELKVNTKFVYPSDIATDENSELLFIADSFADCFYILRKEKELKYKLYKKLYIKEKPGFFDFEEGKPKEIYIYLKYNNLDKNLYVYDALYGDIKVYSKEGKFLKILCDAPSLAGGRSLDISENGEFISVSIPGRNSIAIFNINGNLIKNYSTSFGNLCGQFSQPCYVTVDLMQNIFVVDMANFRVQKLNQDLKFLNYYDIGNASTILGPQILTFNKLKEPFIIVSQPYNKQILIYSYNGKKLKKIELKGRGIDNPGPITKDMENNIYILDTNMKKIYRLKLNFSENIF